VRSAKSADLRVVLRPDSAVQTFELLAEWRDYATVARGHSPLALGPALDLGRLQRRGWSLAGARHPRHSVALVRADVQVAADLRQV
jgi:hypothetical protein